MAPTLEGLAHKSRMDSIFSHFRRLMKRVVRLDTYYVYEFLHSEASTSRMPGIVQMREAFVASNCDAAAIAACREDPRQWVAHARHALDGGAVLFCIHDGNALVHCAWLAATESAYRAIDRVGAPIPYGENTGWTGLVRTAPEYRLRGLFEYGCVRRFDYLSRRGIERSRTTVWSGNYGSHRMARKLNGRLVAKGYRVVLAGWSRWLPGRITENDRKHTGMSDNGSLRP